MASVTATGFEEQLTRSILQSERTRMLILAGLSGVVVLVFRSTSSF